MTTERFNLKGKVAIIAGSGSGLGKAMALSLAKAGADIVCVGRRIQPIEETAAEVQEIGSRGIPISTDVTDSAQVNAMVERTVREFGKVDILINSAGGGTMGLMNVPITEITDEQWRSGLDSELTGVVYCCRAVERQMKEQRSGSVVSMTSVAGLLTANSVVYDVAKAAIIGLTRVLAFQWAPYGIRLNAIAAGSAYTEALAEASGKELLEKMGRLTPDGRLGTSEEVASLALYLASDASDYVTGQAFVIDGGIEAGRYLPIGFGRAVPWPLSQ